MFESVLRRAASLTTRVGTRLVSQEGSLANARRASTALSRQRVERDAVEIYLDDLDRSTRLVAVAETSGEVPVQRAAEPRR